MKLFNMKKKQNLLHSQFIIEESLLEVTPTPDDPKFYEISDISYSHMDDIEEYIRISDIEEKHCFTSMQTFSNDSPLNSMQNLSVIASESEEC